MLRAPHTHPSASPTDRWTIEAPLARGASGLVHRARQRDTGELAALKRFAAPAQGVVEARYVRELEVLRRLDHPRIPALLDHGIDADGAPWLAVALVDGVPLATVLAGAARSLDAAGTIEQIGDALSHAHAQGVVHRDVSPHNILCRGTDAYLVDFGIAHLDGDAPLTATDAVLGTLAYAAPEQLAAGRCSARSDVYGLAACAFELVTGRPPHAGATPAEILARRLDGGRDELVGTTPAGQAVAALIERALAEAPEARPADVGDWSIELAEALDRLDPPFSAHVITRPGSRTSTVRAGRPRRRRQAMRVAVALLGTATIVAGGVAAWSGAQGPPATSPVTLAAGETRLTLPAGWLPVGRPTGGRAEAIQRSSGTVLALAGGGTRSVVPSWASDRARRLLSGKMVLWRRGSQARVLAVTAAGPVTLDCTASGGAVAATCAAMAARLRLGSAAATAASPTRQLRSAFAPRTGSGRWQVQRSGHADDDRVARFAARRAAAAQLMRASLTGGWRQVRELVLVADALERSARALRTHRQRRSKATSAAVGAAERRLVARLARLRALVAIPRTATVVIVSPPPATRPAAATAAGGRTTGPVASPSTDASGTNPGAASSTREQPSATRRPQPDQQPTEETPIVVGPAL